MRDIDNVLYDRNIDNFWKLKTIQLYKKFIFQFPMYYEFKQEGDINHAY